ncbi:MAG: hypothetical protein PF501_07005 [Salinisphaera sp.]|jgi:D-aspartate ligase|nr:hypothetical protein [Salinisphaera sp.]
MKKPRYQVPAVVVGAGINGLGVLRSLARAGVPVTLVDSSPNQPAMRSRFGRKVIYDDNSPDAIVQTLETLADEHAGQRSVLILTMEETVATIARHYDRLAQRYHLTMPPSEQLTPLLHKDGVRAVAESAGARIPRTVRIQTTDQIAGLDALRLPIVVKPSLRDSAYSHDFSKAYRLDNHGEARALLARIIPVLPDVVVQEWIEGSDSDLYFCLQYLPPHGAEPVSFVGRKIRSWPPRVGGTASCTAAPEAAELAEATTRFFRHAGVIGLASMEYKKDSTSGDYVIVEPTVGRTDFQEEVATLNGVNLPLAAYCGALGLPMPLLQTCSRPRVWRERIADIQSAEQTPSGTTRVPSGAQTVDALWRASDPGPVLGSLAQRIGRRLSRAVNRGNYNSDKV